ncbi:MAG: GumC family protein, partial [Gemmatimonadaceae bacterium]
MLEEYSPGPLLSARGDDVIHLSTVLRAARRRWRWIAVCAGLGIMGAIAYVKYATPTYESAAALRIDDKQGSFPSAVTTLPSGDEVLTDLDELRSRALAAEVADSVGLRVRLVQPRGVVRSQLLSAVRVTLDVDSGEYRLRRMADGRFALTGPRGTLLTAVAPGSTVGVGGLSFTVNSLAERYPLIALRVHGADPTTTDLLQDTWIRRSGPQTNVVDMRYRSPDPVLARDVLSTWAALFVAHRQRVRTAEARSAARFLRGQLDTLSAELMSSENALLRFRERAQVVSPQTDASAQVTRLTNLQAQRSEIEDERRALSGTLVDIDREAAQARAGEPSPYRRLLGFPTLLRNQAASEMLRALSDAEGQRTGLLTRRTLQDPDVRLLSDRINQLETQIHGLATTYLAGLSAQEVSMDASLAQFGAQLSGVPAKEVQLARLQRTPEVLAQLATTLQTRLKEAEISEAVTDPSVRIIDPATVPTRPVSPRAGIDLALGLCAGLVLGIVGALTRERADVSIQSREDVHGATGILVLGVIPRIAGLQPTSPRLALSSGRRRTARSGPFLAAGRGTMLCQTTDNALLQDALARLHLNLSVSAAPDARVLLFTSAVPAEGKTTTAASFAAALARRGSSVVLVDADLRRGTVHTLFGGVRSPGLTDVLQGADLSLALRLTDVGGPGSMSYIPSGTPGETPTSLLGSDRTRDVLNQLREIFDVIIIDSAPLNVVADAAVLARMVDGVILVARAEVTAPPALRLAVDQLRRVNALILGTVLTDMDPRRDRGYDAAYGYYYG